MNEQLLKDAQYRKGLSIAFFNATNSAISLCAGINPHEEANIKKVIELRDFFLNEYADYYARVIAKIGSNYKPVETIKKLETAKTLEELRTIWQSLSEDERQDKEIIEATQTLKKKYEKA